MEQLNTGRTCGDEAWESKPMKLDLNSGLISRSSCIDHIIDNKSQSTTQISNGLLGGAMKCSDMCSDMKSSKMDSVLKPQSRRLATLSDLNLSSVKACQSKTYQYSSQGLNKTHSLITLDSKCLGYDKKNLHRIESPKINQHKYGQLTFHENAQEIQWRKYNLFNKLCWDNSSYHRYIDKQTKRQIGINIPQSKPHTLCKI